MPIPTLNPKSPRPTTLDHLRNYKVDSLGERGDGRAEAVTPLTQRWSGGPGRCPQIQEWQTFAKIKTIMTDSLEDKQKAKVKNKVMTIPYNIFWIIPLNIYIILQVNLQLLQGYF